MNALNNTLEFYKTQLEALEKSHETDIMDFINLDEDIMEDFFGDWTKREVELYDYLFETTATLQKAKKIIEHHQDLQELTKKEPHNIDLEFEQDQEAHEEVTLELEEGKDIPLTEWARNNHIDPATARQNAGRGKYKTAKKIGRDWFIKEWEQNIDNRKK